MSRPLFFVATSADSKWSSAGSRHQKGTPPGVPSLVQQVVSLYALDSGRELEFIDTLADTTTQLDAEFNASHVMDTPIQA